MQESFRSIGYGSSREKALEDATAKANEWFGDIQWEAEDLSGSIEARNMANQVLLYEASLYCVALEK